MTETVMDRLAAVFKVMKIDPITPDMRIVDLKSTLTSRSRLEFLIETEFPAYPHAVRLKEHGTIQRLADNLKYHEMLHLLTKGHK